MTNKILKLAFVLTLFFAFVACEEDDATGLSTDQVTNPSLSVTLDFADNETLVETETTYGFTATLSEPQIVNVPVYLTQIGGTATKGDDFDFPDVIYIPRGSTSASGEIVIHSDDLKEGTETAIIRIGEQTGNVSGVSSQTVTFNIMDYTEGDLTIGLEWAPDGIATDDTGTEISATDLADMRLLITDVPYTTIFNSADGSSFEHIALSETDPDGEYYIIADFYAANPDVVRNLTLTTTFDQIGTINGLAYEHPSAISSGDVCENNYFIMAKVTKSGSTYTIEDVGQNNFQTSTLSWSGTDVVDSFLDEGVPGYTSAIVTSVDCDGTTIVGINNEWMQTIWGEEIIEEGTVHYTLDAGTGAVTIPSQYVFTTLYEGAEYIYTVSGSGTWVDNGDGTQSLNLEYSLDQDGFVPNQWMFDNGYMTTNVFVATLTNP